MKFYCMKCNKVKKKDHTIQADMPDGSFTTETKATKRGTITLAKATCPVCGGKMCKIVKREPNPVQDSGAGAVTTDGTQPV
jgi:hypothetical protein